MKPPYVIMDHCITCSHLIQINHDSAGNSLTAINGPVITPAVVRVHTHHHDCDSGWAMARKIICNKHKSLTDRLTDYCLIQLLLIIKIN